VIEATVVALAVLAAAASLLALARRAAPAAYSVGVRLGRPAEGEPGGGSREFAPLPDPEQWQWVTVANLAEAGALLGRAEAEGYPERELLVLGNSLFLARWRERPESEAREGGE
jgi:hypothetical protein